MKKFFCTILILVVAALPFSVFSDEDFDTGVVVWQDLPYTSSYHVYNQSPAHYGNINSGNTSWPISYVCAPVSLSERTYSPATVTVDVSSQYIRQGGCTVYVGLYNAASSFHGSSDIGTYMQWNDSIPGYSYRGSVSTSMGFAGASGISATSPSTFTVTGMRLPSGASGGANLGNATLVGTRTPNQHYVTYEATGSSSVPSWAVASDSFSIYKFSIGVQSDTSDTVRFTWDSNDLSKFVSSVSASGRYLFHGVFVPIALVVDTSSYSEQLLADLDDIILSLGSIQSDVSDINLDLDTIIGYLNDGDFTVISALRQILSRISSIDAALAHRYPLNVNSSAVQYIDYYVQQIFSNTSVMVQQLNDILSTLDQMSDAIGAANDQYDQIAEDSADVHEYEQEIYDDLNSDLGNIVIGSQSFTSFQFDQGTSNGLARVGLDFTSLWNNLGRWNIVYTFSLFLTIALTIIRYNASGSKQSSKQKQSSKGTS